MTLEGMILAISTQKDEISIAQSRINATGVGDIPVVARYLREMSSAMQGALECQNLETASRYLDRVVHYKCQILNFVEAYEMGYKAGREA